MVPTSVPTKVPDIVPLTVPTQIIYDYLETSMKKLDDRVLIEIGRKYGVAPDSMKCRAFALFDQGFSREEVRFLLRSYRNGEDPSKFSSTLRKYHKLWRDMQPVDDRP